MERPTIRLHLSAKSSAQLQNSKKEEEAGRSAREKMVSMPFATWQQDLHLIPQLRQTRASALYNIPLVEMEQKKQEVVNIPNPVARVEQKKKEVVHIPNPVARVEQKKREGVIIPRHFAPTEQKQKEGVNIPKPENAASVIPTILSYQTLPPVGVIKVNQTSLIAPVQIRHIALSPQFWHKVVIFRGAGYSKKNILHSLVEAVSPVLVFPVQFKQEGSSVSFLLKNCWLVIEKLMKNQFKIKVPCIGPSGPDTQDLEVEFSLRFAHMTHMQIEPMDFIQSAVIRRHDKSRGSLDLSAFIDDPELSNKVLVPLWAHSAMLAVLTRLGSYLKAIAVLNLADNSLTFLHDLNLLPCLRVLDVSRNNLEGLISLMPLRNTHVWNLNLDRNPMCAKYNNERDYIRAVKTMAPYVTKLDGVFIPHRHDLPCRWANYVPRDHYVDCAALVDQFLQHFFTLLDGDDRLRLRGMYHANALFSLTCLDGLGPSTPTSAGMLPYSSESRNLLRISDYTKIQQLLSQGATEVLGTLCRLPETDHDPYSFAVDVPFFNHEAAMIVVQGVFREPPKAEVRAFSRLFLLKRVALNEYQITNEMLTICRPTPVQLDEAFVHPKPKVSLAELAFSPAKDLSEEDRAQMTTILSRITEMNRKWARKCLEESKWDMKNTLQVFAELLKMNKLPAEAFSSKEGSLLDRT